MEFKRGKDVWNESEEGWLDPRSKLNEKQSTIGTHEAVVYCPIIDWKTKKKQDLITSGTCVTPWWCHAHEMIVYNKILLKSSLDYSQNDLGSNDILMKKNQRLSLNKWSKLDHPWWLTMQSLWGMGQLRKIITSWKIQWESNEERYKVDEGWASFEKSLHCQWSNGNLMKKLRMNIQQGWRHHADLPLPGVQNSHPTLSKMWQPQQGSWRTDTWRE